MVRKNLSKKVGAIALASSMMLASALPASAAFTYTPVAGTQTTFNKFLVMSAGDNVPNVTFNYTIEAGEAVSTLTSDNEVFQVIPGVTPNAITISATTFGPTNPTLNAVQTGHMDVSRAASERASGLTADTGVEFQTTLGEKYAVQTATVNFANVRFDEPGIYRYIIKETASATDEARGIMHDNDVDRVLDVYVTDDSTGTLVVSGYVMHTDVNSTATPALNGDMGTSDVQTAGAKLADKTDGFTNEYKSKDLVFKKEVTGNQASRDKYFDFTLNLANLNPSDKYTVSIADDSNANTTDGNADGTSGTNSATIADNAGKTNVLELTANASGAITQHFYLQHGQSIAVRGLPLNGTYALTENKEDYKSEAATVTDHTDPVNGTVSAVAGANKAIHTSYKNTRNGIIPTGAAMAVGAVAAAMAAVGGIGFAGMAMKHKKREDKE